MQLMASHRLGTPVTGKLSCRDSRKAAAKCGKHQKNKNKGSLDGVDLRSDTNELKRGTDVHFSEW